MSLKFLQKNKKSKSDLPLIQLTDLVYNITDPKCQRYCLESVGDDNAIILISFTAEDIGVHYW